MLPGESISDASRIEILAGEGIEEEILPAKSNALDIARKYKQKAPYIQITKNCLP